ncbi:hypothetical protein LLEC1_00938 [Akanthomyces lecanii]|uniref:Meiotic recombination protein DMC1 n=1 Tax=Cordyceps confragosa TaxID=2714763 RepID=A0A179IKP3_CORDF|nr:hypothetical protein LLEC1_00938 [Akanthomyces lecanii]
MEGESASPSGGFIPPTGLLSPTPSTTSTRGASSLPHPRQRALNPGGSKEDIVRRYVEETLLNISRRYVKKFSGSDPDDAVAGYTSFTEVAKQLEEVVDMLWRSGTPLAFLQIPFLLKIGGDFTQYVRSFPAAPKATFHLLDKMDHCFASLLCGQDVETQEALPGFENGLRGGMTTTDMVRCRSLVETTRVLMVEIMSNDTGEEDEDDDRDEDDDDDDDDELGLETTSNKAEPKERAAWDPDQDRIHLDAARVYEKTIVQLGNRLGDGALGSA